MINFIYPYTVFSVFPSDFQAKPHTHIKRKCAHSKQNSVKLFFFFCMCVRVFLEPSELRKIVGGLKYMRFYLQCFPKTFFFRIWKFLTNYSLVAGMNCAVMCKVLIIFLRF